MRWIGSLLLIIPLTLWANCDLSTFRWQCSMPPKLKPGKHTVLAFCSGTPVYLTQKQYKIMKRYEHSYMNMVLKVNDQYVAGPCKLASQ